MLPRRCKKCRCYVAPHLKFCPRCGTKAPEVVSKPTKEDRAQARAAQDEKTPVLHGKNIHWIPSEFALRAHEAKLQDLQKQLAKSESVRERNAIRSHIRNVKAFLARRTVPDGKKAWTTERFATKHESVVVFVSPKNRRYVIADKDHKADLIVIPATKKHRVGMPTIRLQWLEMSPYWKSRKKQESEEKTHAKRSKSKKAHRAKKRLAKRDVS